MQPELSEANEQMAKYIAMVVRNAIEDFHCEHLTDEQMKLLNPLIRNAVATALHAFDHYERSGAAHEFVDFHFRSIPRYWEAARVAGGLCEDVAASGRTALVAAERRFETKN